ncbi:MAG: polysulfide reductase NrfD [Nitrospirae bacterium]|nr:polysulfide reductase NrfD [Nitrospirota bacterium]MBF0535258.1 polysulfide reductase NrfD [Nitrospirota bacterium]MBF0615262.1 polysulfide reductase NrfD [Nitrospirota bacterium]
MIEKALSGSKYYWAWICFLLAVILVGVACYIRQYHYGLGLTGMSRDVSWGFYIAQFTFFVGVAASAVMVVLPYYLHDFKRFGRITILGEFLAIPSVIMCMLFIFVDMGQPTRILNVILHPTPNSVMFWDMIVLSGYLMLNIVVGWVSLSAHYKLVHPPKWIKPLVFLSIPWAFSIHTVTAFLYAGLPARHFWLSAIMAVRFLSSAFASGPALLVLLCLLIKKITKFDPGDRAIKGLVTIVTYALIVSIFFVGLELFTAFYSHIPGHMQSFKYLYFGLESHGKLIPLMWFSTLLAITAVFMLLIPATRTNQVTLVIACIFVHVSLWIDKGFGFVIGGFVPNPLEKITEYWPTLNELLVTAGIWSIGLLILTALYRIAIVVKVELEA